MGIFDKTAEIVDSWLGITEYWKGSKPRYANKSNLITLCETNEEVGDGKKLADQLYNQLISNWDDSPSTGKENWRHTQNLFLGENATSLEITLQRTFMNVIQDTNWANEVPVASGVSGTKSDSVDFVHRDGNEFSIIELKWPKPASASENPLKAAVQVLRYGLAYVFSRLHSQELGYEKAELPIFMASAVKLRVLAPAHFYQQFVSISSWLQKLEKSLDHGISQLASGNGWMMSFAFEQFPAGFKWDPSLRGDEQMQEEVVQAFNNRQLLF